MGAVLRTAPPGFLTDRAATRVADVQRQATGTLRLSFAFVLAAAAAAASGAGDGPWLPLHLFLVGGVLNAIAGAAQHLAVTWSASPAPADRLVRWQRGCLVAGAVAVAVGRTVDSAPVAVTGAGAVAAGLGFVVRALLTIRSGARTPRFRPAIDAYLGGLGCAVAGVAMGGWLAVAAPGERWIDVRAAHVTLNLFGLVGTTIAATLPAFVATQARSRMHPAATATRQRQVTALLVGGVTATAVGQLAGLPVLAAGGRLAQLAGWLGVVALLPRLASRQLRWAGPRLVHLGAGIAWWLAATAALVPGDLAGRMPTTGLLAALAVGGVAQVLVGSLAYLGPVLRGGGHQRLADGFRSTRSWTSLAAANVAAASLLADHRLAAVLALAVWAVDVAWRAARLHSPVTSTT